MQFKNVVLAMMMLGATAAQADYQFEIGASYSAFSGEWEEDYDDSEFDQDTDVLGFDATAYFSPVSTANGPLAQAEFLSKASGVAISHTRADDEKDYGAGYVDYESETDTTLVGAHIVLPDPSLIFEATLGEGEDDETDFDYYSLAAGGYITDRITLQVEYSKREFDLDFADEDSIEIFAVTYRQLIQLGGQQNLFIAPYLMSIDYFGRDTGTLGIDAAWYVTRSLGLLAGIAGGAADDDGIEYSGVSSYVGIDYFINENVRIGGKLNVESAEYDADEEDFDGYDLDRKFSGSGIEFDAAVRF